MLIIKSNSIDLLTELLKSDSILAIFFLMQKCLPYFIFCLLTDALNLTSDVGCPVDEQLWCADTPAMTIPQVLIGYVFTSVGYPIGVTVIFSLFSKILGPRPQVSLRLRKNLVYGEIKYSAQLVELNIILVFLLQKKNKKIKIVHSAHSKSLKI
jgi:hypothetical protein